MRSRLHCTLFFEQDIFLAFPIQHLTTISCVRHPVHIVQATNPSVTRTRCFELTTQVASIMNTLRRRSNTIASLTIPSGLFLKEESSRDSSSIIPGRWSVFGRKRRRALQLLLLFATFCLYLTWFRLNNGLQTRYTQRGTRYRKSRQLKPDGHIEKTFTLIEKAASGLGKIGSFSAKGFANRYTADQLAQVHLTVHESAGSD